MMRLIGLFSTIFIFTLVNSLFFYSLTVRANNKKFQEVQIGKIDGKGTIRIRRAKGVEIIATPGDKLFIGDKIITDAETTTDLLLQDGTLVRVGLNTDYKVESIDETKPGLWGWAFKMTAGSIRALVEKSQQKGFIKFKVHTPSGTMGVRGTEILLIERNNELELITVHGEALLGPAGMDFNDLNNFQSVAAGFRSSIVRGEKKAKPPMRFDLKDILTKAAATSTDGAKGESKLDDDKLVLLGLKKNSSALVLSGEDSKEILEKAVADFNEQKDNLAKENGITKFESSGTLSGRPGAAGTIGDKDKRAAEKLADSASNKKAASNTSDMSKKTATQSTTNNVITGSVKKAKPVTYASSSKEVSDLNKLMKDNETAIQKTPEPVYVAPASGEGDEGGWSGEVDGNIVGTQGGNGRAGGGSCYFVQYYWQKYCDKRFFGICTRHKYQCREGNVTPIDCSSSTKPGTKMKMPSSECGPGETRN